ncbi:VOC family protein [Peribacillus simplex]|uniref:VOC family protein n=1 Tax=Peribacillus simplex TaxID=1478 RepID=UPI0011A0E1E6|nr:VOC family protein [Peribacillus simplex]
MMKVTPFLMFEGNAEEAMNYYTSLIEGSKITSMIRYGANEAGTEGSVMQATFTLKDQEFMCIDSNVKHQFTFDSEEEIDRLYSSLADGGQELMPLGDYSFSKKFGWISDKFGVSWQLTLPI